MPNISETIRLQEELGIARNAATNLSISKASREAALREVRSIEKRLGLEPEELVKASTAQQQQDEVLVKTSDVLTIDQLRFAKHKLSQLLPHEVGTILSALNAVSANSAARSVLRKLTA